MSLVQFFVGDRDILSHNSRKHIETGDHGSPKNMIQYDKIAEHTKEYSASIKKMQ